VQHQRTGEAAQAVRAEQASGGLCSAARSEGMQRLEARRRASPAMRSQGETRAVVSTSVEGAQRLERLPAPESGSRSRFLGARALCCGVTPSCQPCDCFVSHWQVSA